MAKIKRDTRVAKQNRVRVSFHRDWNRILIKESIRDTTRANSILPNPRDHTTTSGVLNGEKMSSQEKLRQWALKYNITKRAVSDLLKILISVGLTWLPKDSRTLLFTPRNIELVTLSKGKFW